jgi:dienelactone hydrolase
MLPASARSAQSNSLLFDVVAFEDPEGYRHGSFPAARTTEAGIRQHRDRSAQIRARRLSCNRREGNHEILLRRFWLPGLRLDGGLVYVGGMSAGAAAAAVMGETYPDLYAAIGVHSGLAFGIADDLISAFAAMRQGGSPNSRATSATPDDRPLVSTIVFHGDRDTIIHPRNADHVVSRSMRTTNWQSRRGQVPGGHAYTCTTHTDANGQTISEQWYIHGAGHAWSGGSHAGSYTDPRGPNATKEMLRFFRDHPAVERDVKKLPIVRALDEPLGTLLNCS